MTDGAAVANARAWLERFQGFAPDDAVIEEIAHAGTRFAEVAREASAELSFDSDPYQFAPVLRDLAPDALKK